MIKASKDGAARLWYNILEGLSKNLKGTDGPFPFPTKVLHDGDVLKVDDEVIPYKLGQKLFNAAPSEKVFLQIKGGHNDGFMQSIRPYMQTLRTFIQSL